MSHSPEYSVVIPARYESQRLPGKALLDIAGKPLIQRVWECAVRSAAAEVLIATDNEKIVAAGESFGARVIMTANTHTSGSDRIAECADILNWDDDQVIVNLQGDEPLMPPECLEQVANLLISDETADAASLYWPINNEEEVMDPNAVKVVTDQNDRALMFSRSPIPHPREYASIAQALEAGLQWRRHLGLYAYRAASLRKFTQIEPAPLELAEHLEQLRILESGGVIAMGRARSHIPAGVDTPEDLERMRKLIST